ncbi:hypothetical protein E6C60_2988 [Paenibacillus algicola]|uniref:Uncharacterized protein n=1 Tax=Paenibacillus algicola TaxID=2565926 RepID=A0A4P8XSQ1_9BACL|nr:hypothetical protein [Paenibacillus algicola]QCT03699.1 hypothetical protein E6C60_2988 [Paenibacillus algicola]
MIRIKTAKLPDDDHTLSLAHAFGTQCTTIAAEVATLQWAQLNEDDSPCLLHVESPHPGTIHAGKQGRA